MKNKKIYVLVIMLLIGTILPVSSQEIVFNKIPYLIDDDFGDPPFPGDMTFPYPDFNIIDTSQKKLFPLKILSQFTNEAIIEMIEAMDEQIILEYLENLTSFGPRVTGTTACYEAGDYIYEEFESMDLEVRFHNWSYGSYTDRNVEATLLGTNLSSDEIYIICAHFDSVPSSPGADDDGSGVVAVMASAFIMKDYTFNHTIRFVTFSGEEQGLLGSYEYAAEAYANGDNIIGVLNVDMIGFAITENDGNNIKVFYNTASQWLSSYTDEVSDKYFEYIELNVIPSGSHSGSDHASFWAFGYDAIFYHEYLFNYYYHSPQDTIENMNITYNAKCSKLIIATLAELSQQCFLGDPPGAPIISGPSSGTAGEEYEYTFSTTDPEDDDVYYYIEWGDDSSTGWIGPYKSGEEITRSHFWILSDDYGIIARAKDSNNRIGNWSDPYPVTIMGGPLLEIQPIKGGLFNVNSVIKNTGDLEATDVNWSINLDGGALIGKLTTGNDDIPPKGEIILDSKFVIGFGPTKITITADMPGGPSDTRKQSGFVFLVFIQVNPGGSV